MKFTLPMLLAFVCSLCFLPLAQAEEKALPAEEVQTRGWPNISGPKGNFQGLPTQTATLDNLSLGRLAWQSEARFGAGKGGGAKRGSKQDLLDSYGPNRVRWAGSLTGPIVKDGVVYVASFRPAGEPVEIKGMRGRSGAKDFDEPIHLQLEAEDTLTALDANTGETLWTYAKMGGICWMHGKRGGLQITPAVHEGVVYFVGTQANLYAIDAKTGKEIWVSDLGYAHERMKLYKKWYLSGGTLELDKRTARKVKGTSVLKDGYFSGMTTPTWHGGVRVIGDMVVVNDTGAGIIAFDPNTGEKKWARPGVNSFMAAPSMWEHKGKAYVLVASGGGTNKGATTGLKGYLRLIEPSSGEDIWKEEIGPTYPTLAPHNNHVIVNITQPAKKDDTSNGRLACYEISLEGAKKKWELPDEMKYYVPLHKDSLGRVRVTIQDNRAFMSTHGKKYKGKDGKTKRVGGRFVIADVETGKILHEEPSRQGLFGLQTGFWYVIGDRIYSSWDRHHSPNRGGRKPLLLSKWGDEGVEHMRDDYGWQAFDVADITGGYEVTMEHPIVDGRMYERTTSGHVVCYDFRKQTTEEVYHVKAEGAWVGWVNAMPLEMRVSDGKVITGAAFPGKQKEIGQVFTTARVRDFWRDFDVSGLKVDGKNITGLAKIDPVGSAPQAYMGLKLDVRREGEKLSGSWSRSIKPVAGLPKLKGEVSGNFDKEYRYANTPWLKHQPKTPFMKLEAGQSNYVFNLFGAMPKQSTRDGSWPTLTISLVHDGKAFIAGSGGAFRYSQGWHEIDASKLTLKDGKISGKLIVIAHGDNYRMRPRGTEDGLLAGEVTLDIKIEGQTLKGSHSINWGVAYEASGELKGMVKPLK